MLKFVVGFMTGVAVIAFADSAARLFAGAPPRRLTVTPNEERLYG